jgi:hypothetical protein
MATYQLPPPSSLSMKGDMVENVKNFVSAWNNWTLATGLNDQLTKEDGSPNENGKKLVAATLLSIVGTSAVRVVNTLPQFTEAIKQDPKTLLKELEKHFVPERHILYERFKFNSANQTDNENIDAFVVRLRTLIESCEYGVLEESILRDRLVIGTQDTRSQSRLLRERPVPSLKRCIEVLKATELSVLHQLGGPAQEK